MPRKTKTKIALVYDLDLTLTSRYHPDLLFLNRGMSEDEIENFWVKLSKEQEKKKNATPHANNDILYIDHLLQALPKLHRDELKAAGKDLKTILYPGLPGFFNNIQEDNPDCEISHNIVSVGIYSIITNSILKKYMERIFANTLTFDNNGLVRGIEGTLTSLEKDSAVKHISRGRYVGTKIEKYETPLHHIGAIGDGDTDTEILRLTFKKGGFAGVVYGPKKREKAKKVGDYVNFAQRKGRRKGTLVIQPSNWERGSELYSDINMWIGKQTKGETQNDKRK